MENLQITISNADSNGTLIVDAYFERGFINSIDLKVAISFFEFNWPCEKFLPSQHVLRKQF